MNNLHLAVQFFLQIAVILIFCRLVGMLALRFGQPQLVAAMIAPVLPPPPPPALLCPDPHPSLFPWIPLRRAATLRVISFQRPSWIGALYVCGGVEFRR
jgi:Kef-type K+ transport system membrane component KefB